MRPVGVKRLVRLLRRSLNEVVRVPGVTVQNVLAPTLIMLGTTAVFGTLVEGGGFGTDDYMTFLLPWGFLQGAAFTGAATGVNFARDIERGFVDRLLVAPIARGLLIVVNALSAAVRTVLPLALLVPVALAFGAELSGPGGVAVAALVAAGFAMLASAWGTFVALVTRTQEAGPMMQAPVLLTIMLTTSFAPEERLAGWMRDIADVNPVTPILELARQAILSDVLWSDVRPALIAFAGIGVVLYALTWNQMRRALV
ncbi:MAG TPA: ABC transporter permease [Thermoleophilaceae bacterium]